MFSGGSGRAPRALHALAGNAPFWNHSLDGLAVFSADGLFRVFRMQRPVAELAVVAAVTPTGRVETLLLESDRQISGRLDASTGRIVPGDLSNPWVDDLLDDLGELVSGMGGQVLVVPAEEMPSQTGLAAVYRY
jgi:hypothetical protein